jgi:hypothetical protein
MLTPDGVHNSPWDFANWKLESQYRSDTIAATLDRMRMPGAVFVIFNWMMKLPFFWSVICGSYAWTSEEACTAFVRLGLIVLYTILCFVHPNEINKRRIGFALVWLMRIIVLPLNIAQELGVPQFATQLFVSQVRFFA